MKATPILHRFDDRGQGGFSNITLASGERIVISVAAAGVRIHRLIFFGRIPGRTLHVSDAATTARACAVLARSVAADDADGLVRRFTWAAHTA
jgi:hypothetical protein